MVRSIPRTLVLAGAAFGFACLASPAAEAQATQCTQMALSGNWRIGADGGTCTVRINQTGGFSGTCQIEVDDAGIISTSVRGSATVDANCVLTLRVRVEGMPERIIATGRVWGTAGSRPDAGIAISDQLVDPAFFALARRPR